MRSGEMHLSVLSMLAGNVNQLSYGVSAFCTDFLSSKFFIILRKTDYFSQGEGYCVASSYLSHSKHFDWFIRVPSMPAAQH